MERLSRQRSTGLTNTGLRTWGLLFLILGIVGQCVVQNKLLNLDELSNQQLLEAMQGSSGVMALASLALVLQAVTTCAAPVFCFLLVEGFTHTADLKKYMLRVAGLALLTEIPYNLAISGDILDFQSRNPVFAMLLCLVLLYFFVRYQERSFGNIAVKAVVIIAAFLWAAMLSIAEGGCCLLLTMVIWALRKKPMYRDFIGAVVAVLCCLFNPFYLAAPMGFLLIHFYNGEKGERSRAANYLAYPAALILFWAIAQYVL